MTFDIARTFSPSAFVELVFHLDSLNPVSRSSFVYDADHGGRTLLVAQPIIPVTQSTDVSDMHVTTLAGGNGEKQRWGMKCLPRKIVQAHRLADGSVVQALVLAYYPPARPVNIRSAYRLPLSRRHRVRAELTFAGSDFVSGTDFAIHDISITGMGILIQNPPDGDSHPLGELLPNREVASHLTLSLDQEGQDKVVSAFPLVMTVARIGKRSLDGSCFAGFRFSGIPQASQDDLSRFIHEAQVTELRRLSGLSS
jgi:hypothetical protein